MMKLLLVSDLHIGCRNGEVPIGDEVRIVTLKRIAALAREHDALLVAGDLLEGKSVRDEDIETVAREFLRITEKGIPVLYTPGEGEMGGGAVVPPFLENLNATKVFSEPPGGEPFRLEKEGQCLFVYGIPALPGSRITSLRRSLDGGFHLGLFHAELVLSGGLPGSAAMIIDRETIKKPRFDFYALGRHHHFKLFKHNGRVIGAYPGSSEAVSFAETGDRYVLSLIVEGDELVQIKRFTVNSVSVEEMVFDCAAVENSDALMGMLEEGRSNQKVLRLSLSGRREFPLDYALLMNFRKKYHAFSVNDMSDPALAVLAREGAGEDSLRGEFFTLLSEELEAGRIPPSISRDGLARAITGLVKKGSCELEEWPC